MDGCKLIKFDIKGDNEGSLIAVTGNLEIPFDIKRVFYIFGSKKNIVRGKHANKTTQHVLVSVCGKCDVVVNDGKEQKTFSLQSPDQGLFIDKLIWKEMKNFSIDCVLLVLADSEYDSCEYINQYDEFKLAINGK